MENTLYITSKGLLSLEFAYIAVMVHGGISSLSYLVSSSGKVTVAWFYRQCKNNSCRKNVGREILQRIDVKTASSDMDRMTISSG